GEDGVDEGEPGSTVCAQRGTRVEAEPAYPQQRSANHRQGEGVRRHSHFAVTAALADDIGTHQTRDTGVDVDDCAAREVESAILEQQTFATPDHVSDGDVA